MNILAVFIGGGLGSVVRYLLGLVFQRSTLSLPIATLLANILACLIFAIALKFFSVKLESPVVKLFLLTGICGGLSTFSTFSYETAELMKQGNTLWAIINIAVSMLVCTGIFFLFNPKTS
jgi:fluoride exporter